MGRDVCMGCMDKGDAICAPTPIEKWRGHKKSN